MSQSKRIFIAFALGSLLWVAGCSKSEPTVNYGPADQSMILKSKNSKKPQPALPPEPEIPNQPSKNKK